MDKNNELRPTAEFTLNPPATLLPAPLLDRTTTAEVASDFALPDYLPEIKRLLRVTATVLPESRYLGASSGEFSGAVEYLVCYSGGDGGLWSTRLRQDYTTTVPLDADQLAHGLDPQADTQIDSVVSRVTAPRKLNIRSRLRSRIRAWGDENIAPLIEGDPSPASLERLTKSCQVMRLLRATSEPIDLSDEISVGDGEGEVRVISADGVVYVSEVSAGEDTVNCRGELILHLLTCGESDGVQSAPESRTRKVAFDESVSVSGTKGEMAARAWGRCGDLAVQVEEGRIVCDATIWLEVEAAAEDALDVVADLYATDGETEDCSYRDLELYGLCRCGNGNFTLTGSLPLKETGLDPAARIEDITGAPQIESMEYARGRCIMTGTCRFSVIYSLDGDYAATDVTLPLRYETECGEQPPTDREVEMCITQARARCEGEGDNRRVSVDAEIAVALRLSSRTKRRAIARAVYRPTNEAQSTASVVCYPDPDDSLWSLCKRYHVSRASVEASNRVRFTDDCDLPTSLEGVQYLLI